MKTKRDSVNELVRFHFESDEYLQEVYRLLAPDEDAENEPVKLLEVSDSTFATGRVEVFGFAPTADWPYRLAIAVVTPEEFEAIRSGEIPLPERWRLDQAERLERSMLVDGG